MRLVRFEDESGGFAVDLHPLITVISGLPPHVRDRLVQGLAALPRGSDPGGRGSIEVHGVFLDLNRESLELLELNHDLDVILRSTDLPGAEADAADAAEAEAEAEALTAVDDEELHEARRLVNEQEEQYQLAVRSIQALRSQLAEIEAEQERVGAAIADARGGLDSFAIAGLKVAREELDDVLARIAARESEATDTLHIEPEPDMDAEPEPEMDAEPEPDSEPAHELQETAEIGDGSAPTSATVEAERERIEGRLGVLIDESDQLKRLAKSLRTIDPTPVRGAYQALDDAPAVEPGVTPEVESLIEEWTALRDRRAALAARRGGPSEVVVRRDAAHEAMLAAERSLRSPELDPELVERLESTHDEIFEMDGRTSRFAAARNKRRLEGLRRAESEILEQLGFDSWSSYIMGITSGVEDPARRASYERARTDYEAVEAEVARLAATPALADPEDDAIEQMRNDLAARTERLLGSRLGDDPVGQLRDLRVDVPMADAPVADLDDRAATLRAALEATGAEMPDRSMSTVELRALAAGWLETMSGLQERIDQVLGRRNQIEDEIAALAIELEALPTDEPLAGLHDGSAAEWPEPTVESYVAESFVSPTPTPEPLLESQVGTEPQSESEPTVDADSIALIEARQRVAEGEARVDADEAAVAALATLESQNDELAQKVRRLARALGEHEPRLAPIEEQRVAARNRLRRAENARSAAESARRENRHSSGDSNFVGGSAGAEAVEWYVLARLAQQRSVSFVGSVPLVIDDAFVNWPMEALGDVFTRLERMGEVIQIVYLTEDPDVGAWARSLGSDRALVLDMRVLS